MKGGILSHFDFSSAKSWVGLVTAITSIMVARHVLQPADAKLYVDLVVAIGFFLIPSRPDGNQIKADAEKCTTDASVATTAHTSTDANAEDKE